MEQSAVEYIQDCINNGIVYNKTTLYKIICYIHKDVEFLTIQESNCMDPHKRYLQRAHLCIEKCIQVWNNITKETVISWIVCIVINALHASIQPGRLDSYDVHPGCRNYFIIKLALILYKKEKLINKYCLMDNNMLDDSDKELTIFDQKIRYNITKYNQIIADTASHTHHINIDCPYYNLYHSWIIHIYNENLWTENECFGIYHPSHLSYLYDGTPLRKHHLVLISRFMAYISAKGKSNENSHFINLEYIHYIFNFNDRINIGNDLILPTIIRVESYVLGFVVSHSDKYISATRPVFIDEYVGYRYVRYLNLYNGTNKKGLYRIEN